MDTLKDFAKKLHSAFPTLKAVALSPYIPGERDASFDEDGFPFLIEGMDAFPLDLSEYKDKDGHIVWRRTVAFL